MKTNAQFDGAWRDLINARRAEDINAVHQAAERLAHAARMIQLDQQQTEVNCSHEFRDTPHCIKCGWLPPANPAADY